MNADEGKRDRRFASTLAKGLQILQAFSPQDSELGVRELSRRTGIPPSTTARMIYTLTHCGFLQKSGMTDNYRLGPAVMALGYTARAGIAFLPTAEPLMQELADDVGALVALAVRDGNAAMLTRCWRPRGTPAIWLTEGHRLPLQYSAPGRAILAVADPRLHGRKDSDNDLTYLRSHGFLLSVGGWNPDINACSVPFRPAPGEEAMAFLCGARGEEMSRSRLERKVAPCLLSAVRQLETRLGLPAVSVA